MKKFTLLISALAVFFVFAIVQTTSGSKMIEANSTAVLQLQANDTALQACSTTVSSDNAMIADAKAWPVKEEKVIDLVKGEKMAKKSPIEIITANTNLNYPMELADIQGNVATNYQTTT